MPPGTLRHRWARATILMTSLKQMGAGAVHPLQKAAFDPFQEDLKGLLITYRSLKQDIQAQAGDQITADTEENLTMSVDSLLKRIYAYISWGIRYQADSERDVDQTLEELGFRIPKTGGRRLFDIVIPAVLLVALIATLFWITMDSVSRAMGWPAPPGLKASCWRCPPRLPPASCMGGLSSSHSGGVRFRSSGRLA